MSHVFGDISWLWFLLQAYYLLDESPNNLKYELRHSLTTAVAWCSTAGVNFANILCAFFGQKFCTKLFWTNILAFFWRKIIGANMLIKCWWNWPLDTNQGQKTSFSQKNVFLWRHTKAKKHIFCLGIGMNGGNCGRLILLYRKRPNGKSPDNIHWRMTSQQRDLMWHFFASSKLKHVTCDIWEEKDVLKNINTMKTT